MDSNTPPSFMTLLDEDDSPQSVPNPAGSTPSTHQCSTYYPPPLSEPYNMHNTAYPPQSFHQFPYHPYHQPPSYPPNFSGGFNQNPPNLPPPYYPPPQNEVHNFPPTDYPYYPYYPPPPTNSNYLSAGSNSTPSSTRTGPMPGLGNSGADVDTIDNEGDAEEVVGGVVGGAKKWSVDEDKRLIRAWINIGTDAVVGSDQKKSSFWKRVASSFNEHQPHGASHRSWKTLNGRWNRCFPLVNKWSGILQEVERSNHSGWNDSMTMEEAQKLFMHRTGKRFDLEHWYDMLKDQPKWRTPRTPTTNVGSGSSKRSHSEAEEGDNETVRPSETPQEGGERPEGRKAAKRRLKEKGKNNMIDVVTKKLDEMSSGSGKVANALLTFIGHANNSKSHKHNIRDEMLKLEQEKLKVEEDKIMMMDTSMMDPDQLAYFQLRRAEIIRKRLGGASDP